MSFTALAILAVILFAVICTIEAKLEAIEIALKVQAGSLPNYASLNAQEHRWSGIYYLAITAAYVFISMLATGFTWRALPFTIALLIDRRIFFDYSLKIFRKRKIAAIEGDQPLDAFVRKVLGPNGGYKEIAILIAGLALFIFLTIKI